MIELDNSKINTELYNTVQNSTYINILIFLLTDGKHCTVLLPQLISERLKFTCPNLPPQGYKSSTGKQMWLTDINYDIYI